MKNQTLQAIEGASFLFSLILLPTQLGKHFFLDSSFIFSLPVDYLAPTIYLWDVVVLILSAAWLTRVLMSRHIKIRLFPFNLLLIFLLSQTLSLINAQNPLAGVYRLYQLFIAGLFGTYLANQNLYKIKDTLYIGLSVSLWYETAIGFFQVLLGKTVGFWVLGERSFTLSTPGIARFDFFGQIFLRAYGTFPHPNVLAGFMVIVMPLIMVFKKTNLSFFLAGIATVLSFSRTGIFIFFLEAFLILKKHILKKHLFFFLLILGLLPFIIIRYLSLFNFDALSIIRREELINISLAAFSTSFINGVGLNNFINFTATSELISGNLRFLQPVHNIFLLTLAETGLIGFSGFLLLISFPVFYLFRRRQVFSKTLLFLWFTIFFLGLFDHYFLTLPQGQRLFFLVWGLSFIAKEKELSI